MTNKTFTDIYKDFKPKLLVMASKKIKDKQEVEDLVQDILLRIYNKYDTYDSSKAALNTWLYTVAFSVMNNHFKSKSRQPQLTHCKEVFDNEYTESFDSPENILIQEQKIKEIVSSADKLNSDFTTAYQLKELGGLSYKEISEQLNIPIGTVKSRCKRASDVIKETTYQDSTD